MPDKIVLIWLMLWINSLSTLTPTYLIRMSAWRVSATLYIRSLDDSLSETSYVVRTRSGQQPDTFDTSFLTHARVLGVTKVTIDKAINSVERCNLGVTSRKAPAFLQGLLQFELRLVGGGGLEPPTPCL